MEPDFSQLYSDLELPPDCSLDEFNRAYRRRIAQLHPDRRGNSASSADGNAALSELIATYTAVNRFHRRYGRMPGTSKRPPPGTTVRGERYGSRSRLPTVTPNNDKPDRSGRPTVWLFVLFLALMVVLASWDWFTSAHV